MLCMCRTGVIVVALSLMATSGWAVEVPINNPGFTAGFTIGWEPIEYSGVGGNNSGSNNVVDAGWFAAPANAALSGQQAVILFGSNGAFRQELTTNFQSNTKYTLQFDVGAPDRDPDVFRSVTDYHVGLWRGGTIGVWESGVEMFDANGETYGYVATTAGAGGVWKHVTAEWTTGNLPQEVLDSLIQVRVGEAGPYAVFDNIQLDATPIPEPATMLLLGFASLGLLGLRRKAFVVR